MLLQARETLAEIPDQFIHYMKKRGIKPNPPVSQPAQLEPQPLQNLSQQPQQPVTVQTAPPPQTAPYAAHPPPYSATAPLYHPTQFTSQTAPFSNAPQYTYPQSTAQ